MSSSRKIIFGCLFAVLSLNVFAEKKIDSRDLGDQNSWEEKFDINEHQSGKYNVLVTAEDKAGNEYNAGPFNMYIDPESDLPVTGITNPREGMRVPGNLNIVGTCIDDDKVDEVWLILDGDEEHPVKAEGTEFWSYYLNTNGLFEGPHSIEVYGIDNGNPNAYKDASGKVDMSKVIKKTGKRTKVVWQLDRKAPVIEVQNYTMGQMVSGHITLEGRVTDGNGIAKLEISNDNGQNYEEVKISEKKYDVPTETGLRSEFRFSYGVDTKKYPDGVSTTWFRATDKAGTKGYFAFLYLIDNTEPDVKIVYPPEGEIQNGVFTVAGYAKDVLGLQKLSWQWGSETGDFELVPGNSYWVKEVNAVGKSGKETFTITAVDTMGNVVVMKREIKLDHETDKPVVEIKYPHAETIYDGGSGSLLLRGIASDDDGVVSLAYKVDGGEETVMECQGVFSVDIPVVLDEGTHTVTAYAVDKFGVKGNSVSSSFKTIGAVPAFNKATYKDGSVNTEVTSGLFINPEADGVFETSATSSSGLSALDYVISWGKNESTTGKVELKGGEKSASVKIPLGAAEMPWGILKIDVTATDIYGRKSTQSSLLHVSDLTKIHSQSNAEIYFDDSTIGSDGTVLVTDKYALTGYFTGEEISYVATVPAFRAVKASFDGHVITVKASDSAGPFKVQVTTKSGKVYNSRDLIFKVPAGRPDLTLDANDSYNADKGIPFTVETESARIPISGRVSDPSATVKYRILTVKANLSEQGIVTSSEQLAPGEFKNLSVTGRGYWSIDGLRANNFESGISVVEIVAESSSGLTDAEAVFVKKIPYEPETPAVDENGKAVEKDVPRFYWFKGRDIYGICLYQGKLDKDFEYKRLESIPSSVESINFSVTTDTKKKFTSPSIGVASENNMSGYFKSIDGIDYKSGMNVLLNRGSTKAEGHNVVACITTRRELKGANFKITGEASPGGDFSQNGNATLSLVDTAEDGLMTYEAVIPFYNLPARITKISVVATDVKGSICAVEGTMNIIREHAIVANQPAVYWVCGEGTVYDADTKTYILTKGSTIEGYANFSRDVTATVRGEVPGIQSATIGNRIVLSATSNGTFRDVSVRVKGNENGTNYLAPNITIISDMSAPTVKITSPKQMAYIKSTFVVTGSITDGNGIAKAEYCLDDKLENWENLPLSRAGDFEKSIRLPENTEDGYVPFTIRARDNAGKISFGNLALFKDTTPPEVKVILPDENAVVNGENLIAFSVKDNGTVKTMAYTSAGGNREAYSIFKIPGDVPAKTVKNEEGVEVPVSDRFNPLKTMNSTLPHMSVGLKGYPISNYMSYSFTDDNGNTTVINKWPFKVDEESDKPISSVYLPEDNQVVTTDFVISGIVQDDDGPCKIYYKIDDSKYQLISEEPAYSYKINVPLLSLKDNEHFVTVYAEDINGVRGPVFARVFRVSLEEPKGGMTEPSIDLTVKETVTLKGWASDKNGISKVQISVDNGATYNDAVGTTNWSYKFDTRVIKDGTHVVFIKIWDGYEVTGIYSSLINIDNTPPKLYLELPLDGSKTSKQVFLGGQTTDNIGLRDLNITIRSLDGKSVPDRLAKRKLVPGEIISQVIDISDLSNGFYNIELSGSDAAGNISYVSRNIQLDKSRPLTKVSILYPLNGSHESGAFNIYGTAYGEKEDPVEGVELYIDAIKVDALGRVPLTSSGYFKFPMLNVISPKVEVQMDEEGKPQVVPTTSEFKLMDGKHSYQIIAITKNGKRIISSEQTFTYCAAGPWVTIDNFTYGDFAVNRPLLKGLAGYVLTEEEQAELKNKLTPSERKATLNGKRVKQIYVSFDNGITYEPVSKEGKNSWQYRVENLDIPAGYHFLLVKAEMYNGENAVTRAIVQVDRTSPSIRLISPGEGGRYNQQLAFEGLSSDDIELKNVKLQLRKGDKSSYQVPGFIQGLYFDFSVWGATLFNVGVGLTAFDGAVKVQANFGQFTQSQRDSINEMFGLGQSSLRFGGNVIGGKIIAQLAYIPFRYFFGRDWDWLSATVSIGANFSYFTETGASQTSGEAVPQVLSAVLMQIEFPRITVPNLTRFRTWSMYVEPQLWFIPSDIGGKEAKKYVYTTSVGIRTCVF